MGEPVREPPEAQTIRETLRFVSGPYPATLSSDELNRAHAALGVLLSALAQARQAPSVTCVAYDSHGNPMDTVKLLGDREAILAVEKLKDDKEAAEAELAQARARNEELREALREIADQVPSGSAWDYAVAREEEIVAWMNAPSDTLAASPGEPPKEKTA